MKRTCLHHDGLVTEEYRLTKDERMPSSHHKEFDCQNTSSSSLWTFGTMVANAAAGEARVAPGTAGLPVWPYEPGRRRRQGRGGGCYNSCPDAGRDRRDEGSTSKLIDEKYLLNYAS
jgi:hypothetical protein